MILISNSMHIMSDERSIYTDQQEAETDEIGLPGGTPVLTLSSYKYEHDLIYNEDYFQSDPHYSGEVNDEVQGAAGSLELSPFDPGTSGVLTTHVPMPGCGIDNVSVTQESASYDNISGQGLTSAFERTIPVSTCAPFYNEERIYSDAPIDDFQVSTPLPQQETWPSSTTVKESTDILQTSCFSDVDKPSDASKRPENSHYYKPIGKQRRGRRRGLRRGGYSLRNLKAEANSGKRKADEIITETFETRDIFVEARNAYVEITEQPRPKALRFRYICEGRSAGSILGVHSTPMRKTFPSIRVVNSKGPALVVVSCVTVTPPYRPHPHNLVGKDGCEDGVCSVYIQNSMMECSFSNLGIQCVKKRDIEASLERRAKKGIDPFQTGFNHSKQPQTIDLNSVRLCFQVYLIGNHENERYPLRPIVSDQIFDKKTTTDLVIYKLSASSCSVPGGKEIILLCDKIAKDDIKIRFFEETGGQVEWEAFGTFQSTDVHKQVAISFKTPQYRDLKVKRTAKVWIQLFRPSDKTTSEPVPFEYYPVLKDCKYLEDKILHITNSSSREAGNSDSPVESLQEVSDESEIIDDSSPKGSVKIVKRMKLQSSQRGRARKNINQYPRMGTRLRSSRSRETKPLDVFDRSSLHDSEFNQAYCPQAEYIQSLSRERHNSEELTNRQSFYPSEVTSELSGLTGPTATVATSSTALLRESQGGSRNLLDMDANKHTVSSLNEEDLSTKLKNEPESICEAISQGTGARERSLSPNSESLRKLKQDIEILNKLANL